MKARIGDMTEKTLHTALGKIHYWTEFTDAEKPTLVFLPGLSADHRLFERQFAYFAQTYNLLTWDAPGHAASRPFLFQFSLMDQAKWLHEILEREGIERPVLIGQSMGGYVSQCYMERYPNSVRAFVAIDSAPIQRKYLAAWERWIIKHTGLIYRPYPWKALVKAGAQGCAETEYGQTLMRNMINAYSKDDYCELVCHGYGMLADAIEANLPYTLDCPPLLLCGEQDKAGYTKLYNQAWAKEENLRLEWIPNAGHNSNTDQPEIVNRLIQDFLTQADPA